MDIVGYVCNCRRAKIIIIVTIIIQLWTDYSLTIR